MVATQMPPGSMPERWRVLLNAILDGADANNVDPHDAEYGAKGDAFSAGDAVVSTTSSAGDTVSSAQRDFIITDVGKSLWLGSSTTERTIIGITGGTKALISPAYGSTASDLQLLCGTDDTDAIQAALDAAGTNPVTGRVGASSTTPFTYVRGGLPIGRTVKLRSGCGYIVGNSVASYDGGKKSALIVRRRTGFVGSGPGFFGSALHLKPGSKGHVVANETPEAVTDKADFITLGHMSIYCYADNWNSLSLDGVRISVDDDGYSKVDPFNRIEHMQVYTAGQDGFRLTGRGELYAHDLIASYCKRNGLRIDGLADSRFIHCVSTAAEKAGFHISGGGPLHFVACKSFYSGGQGGSDDSASCAFYVGSDNAYTGISTFTACEAQESRGSSWYILSGRNQFTNCMALDPGRDVSDLNAPTLPSEIAGFKLVSVFCNNNVFANCVVRATLTNFSGSPGNLGNAKWALWVDPWDVVTGGPSTNIGAIEYTVTVTKPDASTIAGVTFAGGGGAKGGGGTSNARNTRLAVNGTACT